MENTKTYADLRIPSVAKQKGKKSGWNDANIRLFDIKRLKLCSEIGLSKHQRTHQIRHSSSVVSQLSSHHGVPFVQGGARPEIGRVLYSSSYGTASCICRRSLSIPLGILQYRSEEGQYSRTEPSQVSSEAARCCVSRADTIIHPPQQRIVPSWQGQIP